MNDLETRVEQLESRDRDKVVRLDQLEDNYSETLLKILSGLNGQADGSKGGLYENVRALQVEVKALTASVAELMKVVAEQEKTRQQLVGAYAACAGIGGIVGFVASMLSKGFHP
jgi:ERCC4-type nuclease